MPVRVRLLADLDVDACVRRVYAQLTAERNYSAVAITKRERFTLLAVRRVFDVFKRTPFLEDVVSVLRKLEQRIGFGLCLWRLGRHDEATAVFERILALNPNDNQGARVCFFDVRAGRSWEEMRERDEREAAERRSAAERVWAREERNSNDDTHAN